MVIFYKLLDESTLVDDGNGDFFNVKVTYIIKQLTAGCVDETSVHHGFNIDNEYNIRFLQYN